MKHYGAVVKAAYNAHSGKVVYPLVFSFNMAVPDRS